MNPKHPYGHLAMAGGTPQRDRQSPGRGKTPHARWTHRTPVAFQVASFPKDFAGSLVEYRKAKPGAEQARLVLDEALQLSLSTPPTSELSANSSTASELTSPAPVAAVAETEAETTTETAKNSKKKRN